MNGLPVFAWSSLARGFFSSHYAPKNPDDDDVSHWCATYFGTEENVQRLACTHTFARRHRVTVARLRSHTLCHPLNLFAVVGCTTYGKFAENVRACSLNLDEATLHWLATGQSGR